MVGSLAHARGRQGFRRLQSHSPPALECTEADFLAAVAEMKVRVGMCMPNTTRARLCRGHFCLFGSAACQCPLETKLLAGILPQNAL
jgi:hypothetical protein